LNGRSSLGGPERRQRLSGDIGEGSRNRPGIEASPFNEAGLISGITVQEI
jgi:hypothetical protein